MVCVWSALTRSSTSRRLGVCCLNMLPQQLLQDDQLLSLFTRHNHRTCGLNHQRSKTRQQDVVRLDGDKDLPGLVIEIVQLVSWCWRGRWKVDWSFNNGANSPTLCGILSILRTIPIKDGHEQVDPFIFLMTNSGTTSTSRPRCPMHPHQPP